MCSTIPTKARLCSSRSCASSQLTPPIAAFRSTSKAFPTPMSRPTSTSFKRSTPRCTRAISAFTSTWLWPPAISDLKTIAANSDGIILMNYDEHQTTSDPGPVASQQLVHRQPGPRAQDRAQGKTHLRHWQLRVRLVAFHPQSEGSPSSQAAGSLHRRSVRHPMRGSAPPTPTPISISTTTRSTLTSSTSTKTIISATWSGFSMRVTVLNELRAARQLGLQTFALWRLGEEDSLAVEHLGPSQRSGRVAGAGHCTARPRCRYRGRGRYSAHHRTAAARQAHRRSGHRRARPAQEAHRR